MTHHNEEEAKLVLWRQLDALYLGRMGLFLGKLKECEEGSGTLLDDTIAAWATTDGGYNATNSTMSLMVGEAAPLSASKHRPDSRTSIANVWQTIVIRSWHCIA